MKTDIEEQNSSDCNYFKQYSSETQELILQYLETMNKKEKVAYEIAKSHLGTSFNIVKSIGYIGWKNKNSTV